MTPDNLVWTNEGNKDGGNVHGVQLPFRGGEKQGDILLSDSFHLVFISKPAACCADDMTNKDTAADAVRENWKQSIWAFYTLQETILRLLVFNKLNQLQITVTVCG